MASNLNLFRGKYSDFLNMKSAGTVVSTNLYFTLPDDEGKVVEGDPKSLSYCLFHGETLLASATHENELKKIVGDIDALTERIDNISNELAVYTVSAVTVDDANVKEAYQLIKTVDGESEGVGEVIKVYKDSALQKVELKDQKLEFTYLTASGATEVVSVDVSSFLIQSEFKNGLIVNDNGEVSVKLSDNTVDADGNVISKNFIEFEGTVDGEKSIAVRSMDTDVTVTTKDIVIAGGPLDTPAVRKALSGGTDDAGNLVIKEGTDIQQLLVGLFTMETYPDASKIKGTSASASVSMSNLTLTLDKSGNQEVGTLVKLTAGSTNGTSVSSKKDSSVSGLAYGWSAANDNQKDGSNSTITSTINADTVNDDKYTISATINSGFNADTVTNKKTTPTTVTGTSSASLAATTLGCIVEGENKITINATGASYSYSAASISSGYCVSNVGNTSSAHTYAGVAEVNTATTKPTKSANATVTGKYYYFLGYAAGTTVGAYDSTAIRKLSASSGWITKDGTTTILNDKTTLKSNGQSIVIACPSKYKLATITNGVGADILSNFTETGKVGVQTGSITTEYMVYIYPITNGAEVEFKNLTLTKA